MYKMFEYRSKSQFVFDWFKIDKIFTKTENAKDKRKKSSEQKTNAHTKRKEKKKKRTSNPTIRIQFLQIALILSLSDNLFVCTQSSSNSNNPASQLERRRRILSSNQQKKSIFLNQILVRKSQKTAQIDQILVQNTLEVLSLPRIRPIASNLKIQNPVGFPPSGSPLNKKNFQEWECVRSLLLIKPSQMTAYFRHIFSNKIFLQPGKCVESLWLMNRSWMSTQVGHFFWTFLRKVV